MAAQLEIEKLTELGKELGIEKEELRDFVREERQHLKDERDAEREERARIREENERARQAQEQAIEAQKLQFEQEKLKFGMLEAQEKLKFELQQAHEKSQLDAKIELQKQQEMSQLEAQKAQFEMQKAQEQLQLEVIEKQRLAKEQEIAMLLKLEEAKKETVVVNADKIRIKPPRLPSFNEDKDDLDAYLQRFERYAQSVSLKQEHWAMHLSTLLTGKALEIYSTLPLADTKNYNALKLALRKKFNLTEEGYKTKFRATKPQSDDNASQFIDRLGRYLDRWIDLAEVGKNFNALREFFVRDQFLQSVPKELALFIRERAPENLTALTKLTESYLKAHKGWFQNTQDRKSKSPAQGRNTEQSPGSQMNRFRFPPLNKFSQQSTSPGNTNRPSTSGGRTIVCHYCRKPGHMWRQCRSAPKSFVPSMALVMKSVTPSMVDIVKQRCAEVPDECHEAKDTGNEIDHSGGVDINFDGENSSIIGFVKIQDDSHVEKGFKEGYLELKDGHRIPTISAACKENEARKRMPASQGYVGKSKVSVLRDSGCSGIIVRSDLVPKEAYTGQFKQCVLIDGTIRTIPMAVINIDTPYLTGLVSVLCMKSPVYDLVLGNVEGVRQPYDPDPDWKANLSDVNKVITDCPVQDEVRETSAVVETRAQAQQKATTTFKSLKVSQPMPGIVTVDTLRDEQQSDVTLKSIREAVKTERRQTRKGGSSFVFVKKNGIIFREFQAPHIEYGNTIRQVVVPQKFRKQVMQLAHESILGGHQGTKKTTDKVMSNFFWPGLQADVRRYCQSCDICQRTVYKGRVTKVPLGETPLIDIPFDRVAVDIVGPIAPSSTRGHRYILVVVDYATRYPEAVPMKSIEAERVAEELVNIYTRLGIPREVLTDQGSQFTANVMKEVSRLLSIRQLTTTPYNPKCNGLVERFNGTLKLMLKKMCDEKPKDWDRYIAPLLFAYRETPQASTGFAPFELLFGRTVRGPMQILKELWTEEVEHPETKSTYQYVVDLRERLENTCKLAHAELAKSKDKYTSYYNKKTRPRQYEIGEEVLLLLPTDNNKLLMQWKGPYPIVAKHNRMDYTIDLGKYRKTFHINLLKKYNRRENSEESETGNGLHTLELPNEVSEVIGISVVEEELDEASQSGFQIPSRRELITLPPLEPTETYKDVQIDPQLDEIQRAQIKKLVWEYRDVFSDIPGQSTVGCHDIQLTDDKPVRSKPYPIPHALRDNVKAELDKMQRMGIIQPCNSPYASPLVVVRRPGSKDRYAVDYRAVNAKTVFDAEPVPDQNEIFAKLANDRYFSKLDLSKGYWQIPMKESAKEITAVITHNGLFSFNYMPFGLVNSGATFSRTMRQVLKEEENVDNYIDDLFVHTIPFGEQLVSLESLFKCLRRNNLTAKPSKCFLGYRELELLGHVAGKGQLKPRPQKIEAIQNAPRPETKSQLRSYLGLTGYYRSFIPNYAVIAAPLTDRTKKGEPNKVRWQESQENAFQALKSKLVCSPILRLPDVSKSFILRTDASDIGIAAVLLQESVGSKFPIAYASKKLNACQRNYSVIERECLAIVWAVQKFEAYLYGKPFVIETDHQPLKCVQRSKVANGRIMRWSLILQPYRYRIEAIKGKENVGADFLSRSIAVE